MQFLPFSKVISEEKSIKAIESPDSTASTDAPIFNVQDIPKELDIFLRSEASFLPEGKSLKDLTPEEIKALKNQYRFSPFRPGLYQGITGISPPTGGAYIDS